MHKTRCFICKWVLFICKRPFLIKEAFSCKKRLFYLLNFNFSLESIQVQKKRQLISKSLGNMCAKKPFDVDGILFVYNQKPLTCKKDPSCTRPFNIQMCLYLCSKPFVPKSFFAQKGFFVHNKAL